MGMILFALAPLLMGAADAPLTLDACVPADAMAVYFGRPSPDMLDAPPGGKVDQFATLMITLKAMGVIPREGRVIADIVGTVPIFWRRPHAVVLMDITSKEIGPQAYRLDELKAALVIDERGVARALDRRFRDLLATYSDARNGHIEPARAGDVAYYRLIDRRLPEWAVIEWGTVGPHFVVAIGRDAFTTMLTVLRQRASALADDPWFAAAHGRLRGSNRGIEVYVDVARLRGRLGEDARDRPSAVLRALKMQEAERLLWTVGHDGRSIRAVIVGRDAKGQDHLVVLAGRESTAPEVEAAIPPAADSYAVLRLPLGEAFRNSRQAYLETQSPRVRRRLKQGWARLEQQLGFDVETDVLDQLGDHLVIHNYPPHPLSIPLLCTIWIQISGDEARVSRTLEEILTAWQEVLRPPPPSNDPDAPRPSFSLSPQVRRDADGIWYLQLGLVGPALAATDGWIVISYSPEAVRQNLAHLRSLATTSRPEGG